jgi:signal transduction histidine kinase
MPFSTQDRPALILLATSRRTASFTSSSINTIRSIGAILLARATQDAVVEADAAKTIFLSSISHELRTPLHSIVAALRLAFGLVEDGQMNEIVPLLGAMRSSSVALQGTLDDVLDFGKPTVQAVATGGQVSVSVSKVNVEEVVRDVVRICLMQQSVSSDRQIVYEHEARDWVVDMDEAKFRRYVHITFSGTGDCSQRNAGHGGTGSEELIMQYRDERAHQRPQILPRRHHNHLTH